MVELCAGLGIGTLGFNHAGMKTVCAADWCALFTAAFCEMHPDIPVVTGGIGDDKVLKQLFRLHPHPSTLMCGFSCQPFSTGRSLTLPKTLCAGYLFRSVAIILECVQDAGTNSMVRSLVDTFASQCGYHLSETTLNLEEVWVSRRACRWAVLTAPFLGRGLLQSFLASEHPRDLFQSPLALAQSELDQLVLHTTELDRTNRLLAVCS